MAGVGSPLLRQSTRITWGWVTISITPFYPWAVCLGEGEGSTHFQKISILVPCVVQHLSCAIIRISLRVFHIIMLRYEYTTRLMICLHIYAFK